MGFFTPCERAALNKIVEVEVEIFDFIRHQENSDAEAQYVATKLAVMIEHVADNSTRQIDNVTTELEEFRGHLQLQGERVQRDVLAYASLSQSAMKSTKVISEQLVQWKPKPVPKS